MNLKLEKLCAKDLIAFKKDMQDAFQKGYEDRFGKTTKVILPEEDIDHSINFPGAICYKAILNNEIVGGAIVVIDSETKNNDLHFLYVKSTLQAKGVGKAIWDEIERIHSDTKVWTTCTPYFEKRNIHFYVNKCHFKIIEYVIEEDHLSNGREDGMFTLEKIMK